MLRSTTVHRSDHVNFHTLYKYDSINSSIFLEIPGSVLCFPFSSSIADQLFFLVTYSNSLMQQPAQAHINIKEGIPTERWKFPQYTVCTKHNFLNGHHPTSTEPIVNYYLFFHAKEANFT